MCSIIKPELPEGLRNLSNREEQIKGDSIEALKSDENLDRMLNAYDLAMHLVFLLVQKRQVKSEDEITIQYVGIRLFNSLGSALRLMLTGYYQISFAVQRDVIETAFLLDYFSYYLDKISDWKKSSNVERIKQYNPKVIRDELDKRDGFTDKRREKKYKMFCEYASHPSYPGNKLLAPKGLGQIGPFFHAKFLKTCFWELTENAFYASLLFIAHFKEIQDRDILKQKIDYFKLLGEWYQIRFKQKLNVNFDEIDKLIKQLFES